MLPVRQASAATNPLAIALVSDIHGNFPALLAVVDDIAQRAVTRIVNLGDSLSGPLWPQETAEFLMHQDWLQLAGNHERQLLELHLTPDSKRADRADRFAHQALQPEVFDWMHHLPQTAYSSADFFVCHGTPRSDCCYFLESVYPHGINLASSAEIEHRRGPLRAAVIACGHTHLPRVLRLADNSLIVNPGSVGLPAFDDALPYFHKVENGSPDARYAIVKKTGGNWRASLHSVAYDFESAARQAEKNGMPDWAHALRTGYMPSRQ